MWTNKEYPFVCHRKDVGIWDGGQLTFLEGIPVLLTVLYTFYRLGEKKRANLVFKK